MDTALETTALPAFPADLATEVRPVAQALPPASLHPAGTFNVWVQGEHLTIPYRLYNPEPADDVISRLSPTQAKILHCLYTRHHDGHVRQLHLNQIIDATDPWIIPFVVQIIGEYVLEIVITIKRALTDVHQPGTAHHQAYGRFAAENPDFLLLTSQRVASYWDCYYRNRFPHRQYPGRILLDSLKGASQVS
ncbi:hypothetical protein ACFQV2_24910 [Actinokineospora soli]|uniref:Uncharacterized protein n=1 Tax=Actinokineospora soli TaxID=1048753 RepID=A0ABW2TUW9_9PSEU